MDKKLIHETHQVIDKPFEQFPVLLLALILCTNGTVTHDLNSSLRNGDSSKWAVFGRCVKTGVFLLSKFERYYNIKMYSGLCNVFLNVDEIFGDYDEIYGGFLEPKSFSTDLQVAMEFRGYEGTLLGIDLDCSDSYDCCLADVSWISAYPGEREILITNLAFRMIKTDCVKDSYVQWLNLTPNTQISIVN